MFGNTGGFSFGAGNTGINPFVQSQPAAPQATPSFSFGGNTSTTNAAPSFGGFGSGGQGTASNAPQSGDMQISPPASPEKGTDLNAAPTASIFGTMSGSTSAAPSNPFAAAKPAETPKPAFSFGQTPVKSGATNATPTFSGFGAPAASQPAAQEAPAAAKSVSSFGASGSAPAFSFGQPAVSSASPAPTTSNNGFSSTAPITNGAPSVSASPFKGFAAPAPTTQSSTGNMFGSMPPPTASTTQTSPPKSTFNMFGSKPEVSGNASTTNTPVASSYPTLPSNNTTSTQTSTKTGALDEALPAQSASALGFRALNSSFLAACGTLPDNADWTEIMKAYLSEALKVKDQKVPAEASTTKRPLEEDTATEEPAKRMRSETNNTTQPVTASPSKSKTANLFQSILDKKDGEAASPEKPAGSLFSSVGTTTPEGSPAKSVFGGFGSTTSNNNTQSDPPPFNPFGSIKKAPTSQTTKVDDAPVNPFASVKKAPNTTFGAPPTTKSAPVEQAATPPAFNVFQQKPTPANPTSQSTASNPFQLKTPPANASSSDAPAIQVPKFGAGPAGGSNFMAAFGAKAKADTEKMLAEAKAKRKAEDFDSEDDDEAEWERKDAEAQAKKRAEIEAAAKSPVPKFGAATASPAGFMASFGARAKADTDKMLAEAKAKRKADDFDSEEDDEAEWEKKDAEEQARKRAEMDLAAKKTAKFVPGKGFVFEDAADVDTTAGRPDSSAETTKPAPSQSGSIFGSAAQPATTSSNPFAKFADAPSNDKDDTDDDNAADDEQETTKPAASMGNSLFDRVTPASPKAQPAPGLFSFSASTAASPAQDNTWKQGTPIKFGGEAPTVNFTSPTPQKPGDTGSKSPFGSLFPAGTTTPTGSPAAKPVSTGFTFGAPPKTSTTTAPSAPSSGFSFLSTPAAASIANSPVTSRASSPGIPASSTGSITGEAAGGDDGDAEETLPQHDFTSLTAEEQAAEDVLFEVERARASLFNSESRAWDVKGTGPLRVLQNKESGVVRLLQRIAPSGKVTVNTRLLKAIRYEAVGKGSVKFAVPREGGKMETWVVKMKEDVKAQEMAEVCEANKGT